MGKACHEPARNLKPFLVNLVSISRRPMTRSTDPMACEIGIDRPWKPLRRFVSPIDGG